MWHGSCEFDISRATFERSEVGGCALYVLTIVFLAGHVTIQSFHANAEVCEALAVRALTFRDGAQAVVSAQCARKPEEAASAVPH